MARNAFRLLLVLFFFLVIEGGVIFIDSELMVAWYMNEAQVTNRIELSEDYGFGMLTLLTCFAAFVLALPIAIKGSLVLGRKLLPHT